VAVSIPEEPPKKISRVLGEMKKGDNFQWYKWFWNTRIQQLNTDEAQPVLSDAT
jgi:hypothetical protein